MDIDEIRKEENNETERERLDREARELEEFEEELKSYKSKTTFYGYGNTDSELSKTNDNEIKTESNKPAKKLKFRTNEEINEEFKKEQEKEKEELGSTFYDGDLPVEAPIKMKSFQMTGPVQSHVLRMNGVEITPPVTDDFLNKANPGMVIRNQFEYNTELDPILAKKRKDTEGLLIKILLIPHIFISIILLVNLFHDLQRSDITKPLFRYWLYLSIIISLIWTIRSLKKARDEK